MQKGLARFKPAVRKNTLLLSSACLWTVIGLFLLIKGGYLWCQLSEYLPLVIAAGFLVGTMKSFWILDKIAKSGVERIQKFADGTCLGAVYSSKTWILVLCMMSLGVILRNSSFPVQLLCFFYFTIGWALLLSSRFAWQEWLKR
jgi:hypothetical protein